MDKNINQLGDLCPFDFQVAGHKTRGNGGAIGLLKDKQGHVLKPVNKSPQGDNEIFFYERLKEDKDLFKLKKFIPEYFGSLTLNLDNKDIRFIKLQDVTYGLLKPCVMDIKIGRKTWDPNASLEKRRAEDAKYSECKVEYGFCIPGYFAYCLKNGELIKFGKEEGKSLKKEDVVQVFRNFFNFNLKPSQYLVEYVIKELTEILEWWNMQTVIHMYSSSVLLIYDSAYLERIMHKSTLSNGEASNSWIKVYVIDFAHVFPANTKDSNYICGLTKLIEVLKATI